MAVTAAASPSSEAWSKMNLTYNNNTPNSYMNSNSTTTTTTTVMNNNKPSLIGRALRKHRVTPPSSENREERTSFASFKEDRSAIAQSFIDSKISSYARTEEAIDDSDIDGLPITPTAENPPHTHTHAAPPATAFMAPLTNPESALHGFVCPCDGFRGWKNISVGGRTASRSYSDLRALSKGFTWETPAPAKKAKKSKYEAGAAPVERLPVEILSTIVDLLITDIPPNGFQPRNIDLMSLLLTSRAVHSVTLATLYSQVTIPHSTVFRKFLAHITEYPALGTIVRRLDFSHFNPTGAGMTRRQRAETQNLTSKTLLQCLDLLPNLREFLAQEHVDEDLSADVLRHLLGLPRLHALDFCASSSIPFRDAMVSVIKTPLTTSLPETLSLTRLSFHECTILPSVIFETILPRLPNLTVLDVAHTRITDKALVSIPQTARLTHLNLSKCPSLSGEKVVEFLSTHPAVKDTLVYLNLLMDAKSSEMLSSENVTELLPHLPSTLRSLNLKGSKMSPDHVKLLRPLTKHVEELGFGRNIPYEDIMSLTRAPSADDPDSTPKSRRQTFTIPSIFGKPAFEPEINTEAETEEEKPQPWTPHSLRYIDVSDMSTGDLEPSMLLGAHTSILKGSSLPLEVIEVSSKVYEQLKMREHVFRQHGWVVKEAGRRGWLVRDTSSMVVPGGILGSGFGSMGGGGSIKNPDANTMVPDDGARHWKMGATYWGMRKVPVARQEVGGMYGLYMFKR